MYSCLFINPRFDNLYFNDLNYRLLVQFGSDIARWLLQSKS